MVSREEDKMVIIILGSKTDLKTGNKIIKYLCEFPIDYKMHIASAHKTPKHLLKLVKHCESLRKPLVYICVAGRSNALGGLVDAQVVHPVINCPPPTDKYGGFDIFSSLRMPSGVAAMTVLEPEQAALAAAKILGLKDKVRAYQKKLQQKIIQDDRELNKSQV